MPSDGVGEQFNVLVSTSLLLHIPGLLGKALYTTQYLQQRVILQQTPALLLLHCFDCLLEPGSVLPQSTTPEAGLRHWS